MACNSSAAIFVPKSDVAFALIGLLIVWTWWTASDRRSVVLAFLAGILAWCGLMMSLALLPVLLFAAIVSVSATQIASSVDQGKFSPTLWLNDRTKAASRNGH